MNDDANMYLHSSGSVECKVCLSVHANTTAYLSHAQGNFHRQNAEKYSSVPAQRSARPTLGKPSKPRPNRTQKLPKYNIIKLRDPKQQKLGIRAEFQFDELTDAEPKYRIMSSYEQSVEEFNPKFQYLVVVGEPYSACAIRLPASPIDRDGLVEYYDQTRKKYYVQFLFDEI